MQLSHLPVVHPRGYPAVLPLVWPTGGDVADWPASSLALPQGFAFTRSGAARALYGANYAAALIASYATDVPRFERLPTERVGLLVEVARTNSCPQSEDFATTWILAGSTISANAIAAPDGATTADKIAETSATSVHEAHINCGAVVSGTVYTLSVFVKAAERTVMQLLPSLTPGGNSGTVVDLSNGSVTVTAGTASGTGGAVALGNGWYRVWHTFTAQSSVSCSMFVECQTSTGAGLHTTYAGSAGSGIYAWGAQFEAGAFPTSYIPTAGSSVTRNADFCTRAVTLPPASVGFSAAWEFVTPPGLPASSQDLGFFHLDANNYAVVRRQTDRTFLLMVVNGGSTVASIATGAVADSTRARIAVRIKTDDCNIALNGTAGTADTSCTVPAMTNETLGGNFFASNREFCGPIIAANASPVAWRPALSNAGLQALSTLT